MNSGVTTVVAAGNDGEGGNHIYSPASVDEAVTVAAINQFDNIASYSSQGGTSTYAGKTTKPDIVAPGGSLNAVPLYSSDFGANDSSPKQGTSMATPIIAGCIQSVIQAMGGYSNWNYSRSQALQPKMILLMTATETYPNPREQDTSSMLSPSLERGGKDVHEGFGRVNLDAAVDAVLRSYTVGTVASDTLGKPPTTSDISVVGQKLAWARNVQLTKGYIYNFSLSVPAIADYDLYLYNSVGTNYGDPIIYAKSTNVTTGGTEQLYITPTTTGTYYVVVKRATEATGSGNFTLTSSQSIVTNNVVLNTPGCVNASNVVHYSQNGIPKNGSIVAGSFSDLVDAGTIFTVDNPIFVSPTQRYSTTQPTTFEVQNPIIENLTIENSHPYPNNYNNSWTITRSNATRMRVHFNNIFTEGLFDNVTVKSLTSPANAYNWSGGPSEAFWTEWLIGGTVQIRLTSDGSVTNYGFLIDQIEWMSSEALSYSANFKTEYYLSVNSPFGSTTGGGWYSDGANSIPALSISTVDQLNGTQRVFMNWSGDASGTNFQASEPIFMNASKTATANWKAQYLVSFTSTPSNGGSTNPAATNMWIDLGGVSISATPNSNYLFSGWSKSTDDITFLDAASTSTAATINGPGTINANFAVPPTPTPTATPTASPSAQPSQSASTKPSATSTPTQAPTATPASSQTPSASPTIPENPQTVLMLLTAALFLVVTVSLVTHQRYHSKKIKI